MVRQLLLEALDLVNETKFVPNLDFKPLLQHLHLLLKIDQEGIFILRFDRGHELTLVALGCLLGILGINGIDPC